MHRWKVNAPIVLVTLGLLLGLMPGFRDLDERLAANSTEPPDEATIEATESRVLTAIQQGVGDGAMPAGILESTNATQVANFVARVAGQ